jgi:uncharacterized membrane protein
MDEYTTNGRVNNDVDDAKLSWKKWVLMGAGAGFALYGLARPKKAGIPFAAVGSLLLYLGNEIRPGTPRQSAKASFALNCPREVAYQAWRDLERLPTFMRNIQSVRVLDEKHSEWKAKAVGPVRLEWVAEIVSDRENELITWRSIAMSPFHNSGAVSFRDSTDGKGTVVTLHMSYDPPAGRLAKAVSVIFEKNVQFLVRENLRRFKALMEAGEIPTTEGQAHGARSMVVAAARAVLAAEQEIADRTAETDYTVRAAAAGGF